MMVTSRSDWQGELGTAITTADLENRALINDRHTEGVLLLVGVVDRVRSPHEAVLTSCASQCTTVHDHKVFLRENVEAHP